MKELVRTNDPVRISWLTSMLAEGGVEAIVLDTHTSILEGQIGAIPRRVMVIDEDFEAARRILAAAEREIDTAASLDSLLDGRIAFEQPRDGYRVAVDPVLLAAAVPPGSRVLDVGTGVGAAALCYAQRVPDAHVTGLELQGHLADMARNNVDRNGFASQVEILTGDLLTPPEAVAAAGFDQVMANPPYLPAGRADPRISPTKAISHVEGEAALVDWIDFCLRMAAPKGTITVIHRADRLDEILARLWGRAGGVVVFPLWPKREVAPKRILVQARVGIETPMRISPGLVLHEPDGRYTNIAAGVLNEGVNLNL